MNFFSKKNQDYTIVIGCSRLGATIAAALSDQDKNVLVLDKNEDSLRKLPQHYAGQTFIGDAMNWATLEEINIKKAQVVIIVTHEDNINIMLSQMVKETYGVERVIARLYDPERDIVYNELGIETIYPAFLEAKQLMQWYDSIAREED